MDKVPATTTTQMEAKLPYYFTEIQDPDGSRKSIWTSNGHCEFEVWLGVEDSAVFCDVRSDSKNLMTELGNIKSEVTGSRTGLGARIQGCKEDVTSAISTSQRGVEGKKFTATKELKTGLTTTKAAIEAKVVSAAGDTKSAESAVEDKSDVEDKVAAAMRVIKADITTAQGVVEGKIASAVKDINGTIGSVQRLLVGKVDIESKVEELRKQMKVEVSSACTTMNSTKSLIETSLQTVEQQGDRVANATALKDWNITEEFRKLRRAISEFWLGKIVEQADTWDTLLQLLVRRMKMAMAGVDDKLHLTKISIGLPQEFLGRFKASGARLMDVHEQPDDTKNGVLLRLDQLVEAGNSRLNSVDACIDNSALEFERTMQRSRPCYNISRRADTVENILHHLQYPLVAGLNDLPSKADILDDVEPLLNKLYYDIVGRIPVMEMELRKIIMKRTSMKGVVTEIPRKYSQERLVIKIDEVLADGELVDEEFVGVDVEGPPGHELDNEDDDNFSTKDLLQHSRQASTDLDLHNPGIFDAEEDDLYSATPVKAPESAAENPETPSAKFARNLNLHGGEESQDLETSESEGELQDLQPPISEMPPMDPETENKLSSPEEFAQEPDSDMEKTKNSIKVDGSDKSESTVPTFDSDMPHQMPMHLPPKIIQQSSRIRDITPQKLLTEADCLQKLTEYKSDIKKQAKRLSEKGNSITEKRAAFAQFQQGQVIALLDDLASKEFDRNFEWSLVQMDRTEKKVSSSRPSKKVFETAVIILYVKRAPLLSLNAVMLLQNMGKRRIIATSPSSTTTTTTTSSATSTSTRTTTS
ncbi:uncharacterized protein PAC_16297 [Phialocephala subalpina]|uniref:Uncharacterized protein n=1 Tax=Phialocephala subalpina TaxID=576137 RepID=A0A1L7XN86_9HELO|nr:uncharacterized protein PAC_16297 [Phialocephala subalpina]